jgi:hypothetical protein
MDEAVLNVIIIILNLKAGTHLQKSLNHDDAFDNDIIFYVNVMISPST